MTIQIEVGDGYHLPRVRSGQARRAQKLIPLRPAHVPYLCHAAHRVLPQNVGMPVAVEIRRADHAPGIAQCQIDRREKGIALRTSHVPDLRQP